VKVQSINLDEKKKEGDKEEVSKKTYSLPEGIEMKEVNLISPNIPPIFQLLSFIPMEGRTGAPSFSNNKEQKGYKIKVDFLTGVVKIEGMET